MSSALPSKPLLISKATVTAACAVLKVKVVYLRLLEGPEAGVAAA